MLGSLTRWLRLLGFDATYAGSTATDDEVIATAQREGRFLATMDYRLTVRCLRLGIPCLLLKPATKEEQLLLLLMHSGAKVESSKFLSRCTECGEALTPADLEAVRSQVPLGVQQPGREFRKCPWCGHVYWRGTHVEAIERKILELAKQLEG